MSFHNIKSNLQSERGFTIVELLIVIVVIGILAAITIVAYNGVTARANATSAKAAANSALKKAEAFNAEKNAYPAAPTDLTTAASTTSYQLTGVTFNPGGVNGTTVPNTAPATPSVLNFYNCTTGQRFDYWDYSASPAAWTPMLTGGATAANCSTAAYIHG